MYIYPDLVSRRAYLLYGLSVVDVILYRCRLLINAISVNCDCIGSFELEHINRDLSLYSLCNPFC